MLKYFLLLVCMSTSAYANIGEIAQLKGKEGGAAIERDNSEISAEKGTGIQMDDTAVTANSAMTINFIDETRVDITEHSRLIIDDFVYDPSTGKGSLGLKASLGTIRYASGQIAKNSRQRVRIRTPSATIGVRGTDFIMVVDETGSSMVTLLPSCDAAGMCYTGEITVETDAGFVVLNKAFQVTVASTSNNKPTPPLLLDIDESMINQLLILRKKNPYFEEQSRILIEKRQAADFLGLDFLQYEGLDYEALVDSIEGIWLTELDLDVDYLKDLLYDMLDQLNEALKRLFSDELADQNAMLLRQEANIYGLDPLTGISLLNQTPNWVFSRRNDSGENFVQLRLNQAYGYTIDLQQNDWELYDYRLGDNTGNSIDIYQQR
tara:strand:+ start:33861 stop:34994 length:1134 start_codon:yes stop_codon:yes gene_type:complete